MITSPRRDPWLTGIGLRKLRIVHFSNWPVPQSIDQ